jgi:hypothetical protein
MRPTILFIVALAATLVPTVGCEAPEADQAPETSIFRNYGAGERGLVHSTLMIEAGNKRLSSVTQLADGTCLAEEARLDAAGRVLDAQATLAAADSGEVRHVALDARRGAVEVSAPNLHIRWKVPNDLPWAWSSLLGERESGAPIATPLGAVVAMRAASADRALRWLDLDGLESHTIMADQVLVAEGRAHTVVLGDDAAELQGGLPQRIHHAALGRDLLADDAQAPWTALAAFSCVPRGGSRTL